MTKTFRVILFYFFAIAFAKLFGVFRTFLLARIINPSEYGVWVTLMLIVTFGPILSFGVIETLIKQVSFYLGKKDRNKRLQVEGGVFGFLIIISIIIGVIIIIFNFNIPHSMIPYRLHIQIMLFALSINMFSSYFVYRLRAYQNFKFVSILQILRTIILLICQIPLVYLYSVLGATIGYLFCELTICLISALLSLQNDGKISILFNKKLFLELVKIGFPITIVWWIYIIQSTTDRVICMWLLGKEFTGYYGLGISFVSVFLLISASASNVLYPKMNESYGKSGKKVDLMPLVLTPTIILSIILPIIIIFIYAALPFVYKYLLNNYM